MMFRMYRNVPVHPWENRHKASLNYEFWQSPPFIIKANYSKHVIKVGSNSNRGDPINHGQTVRLLPGGADCFRPGIAVVQYPCKSCCSNTKTFYFPSSPREWMMIARKQREGRRICTFERMRARKEGRNIGKSGPETAIPSRLCATFNSFQARLEPHLQGWSCYLGPACLPPQLCHHNHHWDPVYGGQVT